VDLVIGADGANSRVAKEIGAGEYDYAIAFQVSRPAGRHTMTARSSLGETAFRLPCWTLMKRTTSLQERIRIPEDKMDYYKDLAEMYVGDDVSPDFYGWVFPKYDHVAVGTGTVVNKPGIKQYQQVGLSCCTMGHPFHMFHCTDGCHTSVGSATQSCAVWAVWPRPQQPPPEA
jgi:geranylgeranyl diphosphate/geranylgeranyl-bacteriochlorophyllide a reductase